MANKAISELPQALNVNNQDLFVLEQSGIAKKLTAETFITEQGIIDALAEALDGHGGISSVTLSSVSGRIRTYLITFTDETATTFQVLDGTSIDRIVKTSTAGLTDTYTVFMNDGTTTFFTVTNGADGNVSEAMLNDALKDKAPAVTETTESSAIANFPDGADDMVMHNIVAEINPVQDLTYGDPYPAGGGKNKFYSSISNSATLNGVTCSFDANTQTFTINGANKSSSAYILLSVTPTEDIVRNVALSRAFIGAPTSVYINLVYNDGSWHGLNNGETLPDSVSIENVRIQVGILGTAGSFTTTTFKCQLQEGSSAPASWTPYENICPITGWTGCNVTRTGKNLFDETKYQNLNSTYEYSNDSYHCKAIQLAPNTKFTVSHRAGTADRNVIALINNVQRVNNGGFFDLRTASGSKTFTTDSTGCLYIGVLYSNDTAYNARLALCQVQIELGSTATAYESYQDSSVTVDWSTEAGTVYGGTVDVATGLLTVDAMLEVFNQIPDGGNGIQSQIDYCLPSTGVSTVGDYTRISFGIRSDIQRSDYNLVSSSYSFKMCNMLKHYFAYNDESSHWYRNTSLYAFFPSSLVGTTATSVINYLKSIKDTNPLSFWIPLAHPQTYQLSGQQLKTLLGTNNVWADTGNVSVTYPADTKMFIEKLTQPTEDDMTANQAITSGKFFMVGNNLYLATAAIASGAKIIEGTNATRLSLADALNRLS